MTVSKIYFGDCLKIMPKIPDHSVDMILADLPYGTTACKWDIIIPLEPLWKEYKRVINDRSVIVLTASQPFTSALIMSNIKMFKYELIWDKPQPSNSLLAKKQPLKYHENIVVFGGNKYNPIMWKGNPNHRMSDNGPNMRTEILGGNIKRTVTNKSGIKYPKSIIKFTSVRMGKLHPTQKPLELFEYLIKTYTKEGDLVLDNVAGSGTTGIACLNTKRRFILIEKDREYYEIMRNRLKEWGESK